MQPDLLKSLLQSVREGKTSVADALQRLDTSLEQLGRFDRTIGPGRASPGHLRPGSTTDR
jgi:hypothetical protein